MKYKLTQDYLDAAIHGTQYRWNILSESPYLHVANCSMCIVQERYEDYKVCQGCPIAVAGEMCLETSSLYQEFRTAMEEESLGEARKAAQNMLDFLTKMIEEGSVEVVAPEYLPPNYQEEQ